MDSAATEEKLQQLRANLIANRMNKEKDASKPAVLSVSQTVSGMSPLSSIPTSSPFIPGLSIFQQKLAMPQTTEHQEPSPFGEPSPPRQLQAATALQPSSFGEPSAPHQLQMGTVRKATPFGRPSSPLPPRVFGQAQPTMFGHDFSPRPLQAAGVQQSIRPPLTSQTHPMTFDQKGASQASPPSPPGQDFNPWTPPKKVPVKLPQKMTLHDDAIGSITNRFNEANTRSNALIPPVTHQGSEDLHPDLHVWLEVTGYHDKEYRETTLRKHKVEKMVAERRKALDDAQAELEELLQEPVNRDNTVEAWQAFTGAKRARSPSPGMDVPMKRQDNRGGYNTGGVNETDLGRRLTFPDVPQRASSYYRPATRSSSQDARDRSLREREAAMYRQHGGKDNHQKRSRP